MSSCYAMPGGGSIVPPTAFVGYHDPMDHDDAVPAPTQGRGGSPETPRDVPLAPRVEGHDRTATGLAGDTGRRQVTTCGVCGGRLRSTRLRSRDRFLPKDHVLATPYGVKRCPRCRMGWTTPRLDDELLASHYDNPYYARLYHRADLDASSGPLARVLGRARAALADRASTRRMRRAPFADLLRRTRPGRLLDVGCGGGDLMRVFADHGWDVYGIDPTAAAIDAVRALGMDGEVADVSAHAPAAPYDLVAMHHVLEHLPDPVAQLSRARTLVAPAGRLLVVVPNWSSWQRMAWRGRWSALDLPRHQQHFSRRALERAARASGWDPIATGRGSLAATAAYTTAFVLFGSWPSGWRLAASYALALPVWALHRLRNDDYCWMLASADPGRMNGGGNGGAGR